MFKSARWRSEKNKVKVVFKLQFHAAKVPKVGDDSLLVSIVPADAGKPTLKSDKALLREGSCFWENPVYESVKFNRDPKSGKILERIYYFVVGTGSSKSGVIGEASIDFSNYAESNKVSMVSLPLKCSKPEAVLNVSIQRMMESVDHREDEDNESVKSDYKDNSLKAQMENGDLDEPMRSNSDIVPFNKTVSNNAVPNRPRRESSGSDITMSSSESDNVNHEWLRNTALEAASTDNDSLSTPREKAFSGQQQMSSDEPSGVVVEKLKSEVAALSRQASMSDLELQTLRKQIVKESKRGQDLFKEVVCLKQERDALRGECERIKIAKNRTDSGGGDSWKIVEELRQELNHAKEINSNLQIQLQKTQESNSELILAVRDLDEMLEQKNKEILRLESGAGKEVVPACQQDNDDEDDDEEQKALEELVKEHGSVKEAHLLEQQILEMRDELETFKRDKDELEMQMEQLALDYEIMRQENHEMAYRLEQSEIQEQLKMQYECSSSYNAVQELEAQVENLENELKIQTKESENAQRKISELEAHAKSLEEELEKRLLGFEVDLDELMRSKVEQEQRAIRAEETLRKTKLQNANTAERLQEEFKRLYVEMVSTFETNERVAAKAMAEANEHRLQKIHLEESIKEAYEDHKLNEERYEAKLDELSGQVGLMTNQIMQLQSEIEDKSLQLENQKRLENEFEKCTAKIKVLSEEIENKGTLMRELEQKSVSVKEMEILLKQGNDEMIGLEKKFLLAKSDAEQLQKELNKMKCIAEEKELIVEKLQEELVSFQLQVTELKHTVSEDAQMKEILRKQLVLLKGDIKKRDDALNVMEKKICGRSTEVANLKERLEFLENQVRLKENALEASNNAFLEKEKELSNEIGELEGRLEVLNQTSIDCSEEEIVEVAAVEEDDDPNFRSNEEAISFDDNIATNQKTCTILSFCGYGSSDIISPKISHGKNKVLLLTLHAIYNCSENVFFRPVKYCADSNGDLDEAKDEMAILKERNKLMEAELKEMQERYSEISVKFAEVEGERQQLVMRVRNLKNAKKKL
ncbi:myosin heavy chain-related protein [Striga asiatica]|uniref:Myosin heavy chain-related protein n=1 Tax=Striga asiatica TaxID=4170 RepID=A0A5A7Q192_STRAF|nr:myosin heavy chain-related protein [Striga asiatica]